MRIYSLFDRKVREYGGLVLSPTDEASCRALAEGLPPGSTVAKFPGDFDLMYLGDFSPEAGLIYAATVPVFIACVADILQGGSDARSS